MAQNATVTVGTTPTVLFEAAGRHQVLVTSPAALTLGGPNVAVGQGATLAAATPTLLAVADDALYAIAAASTNALVSSWLTA